MGLGLDLAFHLQVVLSWVSLLGSPASVSRIERVWVWVWVREGLLSQGLESQVQAGLCLSSREPLAGVLEAAGSQGQPFKGSLRASISAPLWALGTKGNMLLRNLDQQWLPAASRKWQQPSLWGGDWLERTGQRLHGPCCPSGHSSDPP